MSEHSLRIADSFTTGDSQITLFVHYLDQNPTILNFYDHITHLQVISNNFNPKIIHFGQKHLGIQVAKKFRCSKFGSPSFFLVSKMG